MEENKTEEIIKNITGRVKPQIYSFTLDYLPNYVKVGDTYRPLNKRIQEWKKIYEQGFKFQDNWIAEVDNNVYFRDYAIHNEFINSNKTHLKQEDAKQYNLPYYSKEFFEVKTPKDIDIAIENIKEKYKNGNFFRWLL